MKIHVELKNNSMPQIAQWKRAPPVESALFRHDVAKV